MRVLTKRGQRAVGTDIGGRDQEFMFYRDLEVSIRCFPEFQLGRYLLIVAFPRFAEPVFSIYLDKDNEWVSEVLTTGPWIDHLEAIKDRRKMDWREISAFDPGDIHHLEIADDLLIASAMLANELGQTFTSENLPSLRAGILLKKLRLQSCQIHCYKLTDGTPMQIHVEDVGGKTLLTFMHHSLRGWDCMAMIPGQWIDEVLESHEKYERSLYLTPV